MVNLFLAILPALVCSASQFRTFVANPSDSVGDASACADVSVNDGASCNIRSAVQWCVSTAVAEGDECTISMQAGLSATIDASLGEISVTSSQMSLIIDGNNARIAAIADSSSLFFSLLSSPFSNLTFYNLSIVNFKNSADGAAIYVSGGGAVFLSSVLFLNNSCARGCGLFVEDVQDVLISDCSFSMNSASIFGSGVSVFGPVDYVEISRSTFTLNYETAVNIQGQAEAVHEILIADSEFADNLAFEGAALFLDVLAESITVLRSRFLRQYAQQNGGAVFISATDEVAFIECEFENNEAFQYGGAVHILSSRYTTFFNSLFLTNKATYHGGAAYIGTSFGITFDQCNFIENEVYLYGGALYFLESNFNTLIKESNFSSNRAVGDGSAVRFDRYNVNTEISDCLFQNNNCSDICSTVSISALNSLVYVLNSVFYMNYSPGGSTITAGRANSLLFVLNSTFVGNAGKNGKGN
jgi:hypothetical protein